MRLVPLAIAAVLIGGLAVTSAWADVEFAPQADPWYGNWGAVVFAVLLVSAFVIGLLRTPGRRPWAELGLAEAYFVALFTEMFGIPLTIYLLGSVLGVQLGLGMLEGHLWAALLDHIGLLPLEQGVMLVMTVSDTLILGGLALMAFGWRQLWRARGTLVQGGLYGIVRHPQYAGFLLFVTGFLLQWPTLPTLLLYPILVIAYYRLARSEERALRARFGEAYASYRDRTPMLVPRLG
ncbi:MAG: methyltransferase family protein [Candidatus Limnocylindria bacterium]